MQKVAAFLLERRDGSESAEIRSQQVSELKTQIRQWLDFKGGGQEDKGEYLPEDGSAGKYQIEQASDGTDEWWMLKLQENTVQGRQTIVAVSITASDNKVSVYLSMEVGWASSLVRPIEFDPRCPRVVRDLLKLPGRFFHGTTLLRSRTVATGFDGGDSLVAELLDPARTVPIVVISHATDGLAFPNIDERVEHSLLGLVRRRPRF